MTIPTNLSPQLLRWWRVAYDLRSRRGTAKATVQTFLLTKLPSADVTAVLVTIAA